MNEQWQDSWEKVFRRRGFVAVDAMRALIWDHADVKYWYAQNLLLNVREENLRNYPGLADSRGLAVHVVVVHPGPYSQTVPRLPPQGQVSAKCLVSFVVRLGEDRWRLARRRSRA